MWDVGSGHHLYTLPGHEDGVHSTAVTDEGKLAITGASLPSLQIWDILSPPVIQTTQLHSDDVSSLMISGCSGFGVSGSKDGTVCMFDAHTMTVLRRIKPHSAAVNHILLYKDLNKFISASSDGSICLWSVETGEIIMRFEDQNSPVCCLAITASKDLLMSGNADGEVAFWNIHTGQKLKVFSDYSSSVLEVAFIRQKKDQFMLSCSNDGDLCIREFKTAKTVVTTQLNTGKLVSVALAPNATFMVCGSNDYAAYIISLPYGTLEATLSGHNAPINSLKIFPDSSKCITGSSDCTLCVWSITEAQCNAVFHVDMAVTTCDINHNLSILYGTEGGWVFTAAYQSDPSKSNVLVNKLKVHSSTTLYSESGSTLSSRMEAEPFDEDDSDVEDKDEEKHSQHSDNELEHITSPLNAPSDSSFTHQLCETPIDSTNEAEQKSEQQTTTILAHNLENTIIHTSSEEKPTTNNHSSTCAIL